MRKIINVFVGLCATAALAAAGMTIYLSWRHAGSFSLSGFRASFESSRGLLLSFFFLGMAQTPFRFIAGSESLSGLVVSATCLTLIVWLVFGITEGAVAFFVSAVGIALLVMLKKHTGRHSIVAMPRTE